MSPRHCRSSFPFTTRRRVCACLFERLYPALDALGRQYEVIFVDDGSRDRSVAVLREQFQRRPDVTRVIVLARNAGQHMAILAGFAQSRGDYVITLDADLQNPPEEIAKIVAAMDEGADYVGTIRARRHDVLLAQGGLAPDESDPRADHRDQYHRPGLHVAWLSIAASSMRSTAASRSAPMYRRSATPSRAIRWRSRSPTRNAPSGSRNIRSTGSSASTSTS